MYCNNCGKQLSDGAKFCSFCGKMSDGADSKQNYTSGQAYKAAVESDSKKLWSKGTAYAIGAAALAVSIILSVVLAVGNYAVGSYTEGGVTRDSRQGIDEFFSDGIERGYGNHHNGAQPWEYFDDDDIYGGYGIYGGMPNGGMPNEGMPNGGMPNEGMPNGGGQSNPSASPEPKPTAGPWWPADENGKYPTDEGYKWPTGDGRYEYYEGSTIPTFESVTGAALKKTYTEDGNTYYTYDLNENAYNRYIEALKEKGFKQSDFEVKGQNSYEIYKLGDDSFYEYLIIYHMNSDNELTIMA